MNARIVSFVRKAEAVAVRIEAELRKPIEQRRDPLSDENLRPALEIIKEMRQRALDGTMPDRSWRERVLGHLIVDEWPWKTELAGLLRDLEDDYVAL